MALTLGLIIFFSLLGFALVMLLIVCFVANKYLKGDLTKLPEDDEDIDQPFLEAGKEIDELEANNEKKLAPLSEEREASKSSSLLKKAQEFQQFNEKNALSQIRENVDEFTSRAIMQLQLQYIESTKCIVGNIRSVQGFNFDAKNVPKDIQFHLKLLPGSKFRMKTAWRPPSATLLALSFTIGPVSTAKILKCRLCLRLYGRMASKLYGSTRCYGESSVDLKELVGKERSVEFQKYILPKGKDSSDYEELRFTTDSEAENTI